MKKITLLFILYLFFSPGQIVFCQPIDIGFDGSVDRMTSMRFQRHIWIASDGTLAAVIQRGNEGTNGQKGLVLIRSKDNGQTWSFVGQISSSNIPTASGVIDSNNNIWLVYSVVWNGANNNYDVKFRKLTYTNQTWTIGPIYTVVDAGVTPGILAASQATIVRDTMNILWIAFRVLSNKGNYRIGIAYSIDDGLTWKSDRTVHLFGELNNNPNKFPALVKFGQLVGLVYTDYDGISNIMRWAERYDSQPLNIAWTKSDIRKILQPDSVESHFSVTSDDSGHVHLVYHDSGILYQKYTSSWELPIEIFHGNSNYPNITTDGANLWVFFSEDITTNQKRLAYKKYNNSLLSWDPVLTYISNSWERFFGKVWIYTSTGGYDDVTNRIMTGSNLISQLGNIGDFIEFGMEEPFEYIAFALSQGGLGGGISWQYWDGLSWVPLQLQSGTNINFGGNGYIKFLLPAYWTPKVENGEAVPQYYIRAEITSTYSTPYKIIYASAIRNNKRPAVPEKVKTIIPVLWQEGRDAPPYHALIGFPIK